eukprot:163467_1
MAYSWRQSDNATDYKTQRWYGNTVGLRTQHGYLNIEYEKKDNTLIFHCDGLGRKQFENIQQLLNVLKSPDHRIFLEWCQETGSYIYFNLYKIIETLQQHESIDVNTLTINKNKNKNKLDKSCYFDESVSIESQLNKTDTLILSPLRSMLYRYTPMGIYEGHQIYLGPIPTEEFIKQFKIKYIFNCCQKKNVSNLIKNTQTIERVFSVASWKWNDKYIYKPLKIENDSSDESKEIEIKMNKFQFLDAMIDEIHQFLKNGNIIIHCLAGAHRSPFITGCYLYKYGLKDKKITPQEIYKHLKGKRSIVQELGYDKQIKLYQEYLKQKYPHYKKD